QNCIHYQNELYIIYRQIARKKYHFFDIFSKFVQNFLNSCVPSSLKAQDMDKLPFDSFVQIFTKLKMKFCKK
ncbi:MAG: hypothetical protein MJ143_02830, partial [Clostridia bacterium]|nr:hypothetical protein [Clostridia bacterium]